jgi:PAS domain S-box-containing protein
MTDLLRVLLVEDNPADVTLIRETLPATGPVTFRIEAVSRLSEARARVRNEDLDIVLLDLGLPDSQGLTTFTSLREAAPNLAAIVLTGYDDEETAVAAVRQGAQDYLIKGQVVGNMLVRATRYAVERKRTEVALHESERRLKEAQRLGRIGDWEIDLATRQLLWSDAVFEMYERDPKLGAPTAEQEAAYYSVEDAERLRKAAAKTMETGEDYEVEACLRLPEGRCRQILAIGTPVRDDRGRTTGLRGTVQDITKRKEVDESLRESEERYRAVAQTASDAIVTVDAAGNIVDWNRSAEGLFGYSAGEAIGQPTIMLMPLPYRQPHLDSLKRVVAGGERKAIGRTVELEGRRKDGSEFPIELSLAEWEISKGRHYSAIIRDITERKQSEQVLKDSETRFRSLIENGMDQITIMGSDGRFLYISPSVTRLLGYRPTELMGQVGFGYLHPDDAPHVQAVFASALAGAHVAIREQFRFRHKDGSWRVFESVVTNLMAEPTVAGLVINSRDVTDRVRAEEALSRREADYRGLVENAPLGIYRSTPDGRFRTVNRALVAMLGYDGSDEVLDLDVALDVYADPLERAELVSQVDQRDEVKEEVQWKRKDGTRATVRLIVRVVRDPTGAVEYFEGLVEDITQQRSLENQFRQAQRLESVGRLAGGVAHDFNNILTAITGYSDLLLEELGPEDPKREDLLQIRVAVQRAVALTRQLLAFSRKQVLQTRVLSLNDVVRAVESMLHRLIGEDVKLECALAEGLGAIRADPGQLEQVILNLAVNSRDAMPEGGRLTIETANVELGENYVRMHTGSAAGRYVLLAVSDTGIGMDAETRSQIFEPFFTTKELGKGTGLGLATVYGIVKQSGGHLWVYSEPGQGATFKIYLPWVDAPIPETEPLSAIEPVAGGRETVLLAEDDPAVRELVADVLTKKGYHVLRAADGLAALAMARAHPKEIRLLVTDLVMPGMTGRQLAEALAVVHPNITVLFMSGYTDDAVVRHAVLEEGVPYIQKPFAPRALAAKVRELLDGSRVVVAP